MPNGNNYLLKAGGTMTGAINMGGNKATNLGAPSAATDATTKAYVDGLAAPQGGLVPWGELRALANTTQTNDAHWGDTWEARAAGHMIRGVAACLGNNSTDDTMNQASVVGGQPSPTGWGRNCFCRVSSVNGVEVLGPWVFNISYTPNTDCYSYCATRCSYCVRFGTNNSCSRSKLFAAP
jgi:hypothetical protein